MGSDFHSMRLNRHDDAGWRAIARSCGVPEDIAAKLWLRVEEDAKYDPLKAELAFRRLLEETIAVNALSSALEISENHPATPGKATRVIDVADSSADATAPMTGDADSSPVERLKHALIDAVSQGERAVGSMTGSNAKTIAEALRRLGQGNGKALWSVDDGSLGQVLRLADALVTMVEQHRAAKTDEQSGEQLDAGLRGELESKLGVDFGNLRVHTDAKAAEQARGHGAIAFAQGTDVYFADGAYDPSSREGRELIAHEATHVAQQRDGGSGSGVSAPGSAVELEADRVAGAFAAGMSPGAREFAVTQRAGAGTISRKDPEPAKTVTIKSTTTAKAASGGSERYTVGVGEEVKFEAVGGESGDWTASGGTPGTTTGPSLLWNAPGSAGQFQIQLKVGASVATKSVAVILPTGVKFTVHGTYGPDSDDMMGAGMELDMQLEPLTVSFTKATIREKPGGAHGLTGYFKNVQADLSHKPSAGPTQVRDNNKTGSYDDAHLMDDKNDPWPKPLKVGSMQWDIPYLYSAGDVTDASFAIVLQTMGIVDSKGTVTVTKGSASTSRTPTPAINEKKKAGTGGSTSGRHVEKLAGKHDGAKLSGGGGSGDTATTAGGGTPKNWKVDFAGQALDLSARLAGAHDNNDGTKTMDIGQTVGPLKISSAKFKQNAAGDKVESATISASIESGVLKGTSGLLSVNAEGKASGTLIIPIKAPKMFGKDVSVEIGDGKIIGKVKLQPSDFAAPDFPIKTSEFELTVTGSATGVEVSLTGTASVTIENGMASGAAEMTIDLKAGSAGVTFTATVKGKIAIAGIAEANAVISYDGNKVTMDAASSSIPVKLPGIEGTALIEYKAGKLSLDSTDLRFTLPELEPVKFISVHGEKSKLAAELSLTSPIKVPLPGGASLSLDRSTIKIDGTVVGGDITGTFNLGNEGGFAATATLAYAQGGGFSGSVTINGGAEVKLAGVEVSINAGSHLTIAKNAGGLAIEGDIGGKVKLPGIDAAQIDAHVIAKKGEPIDLTVDGHLPLVKLNSQLGGDVHVTYKRGGGANSFSLEATSVSVNVDPVKDQVLFKSLKAHLAGKEITGSLTANPGTVVKVGSTSVTIVGGEIHLLPGKILDGHLTAKSDNGGTSVEATVGWNQGKFDWAAEGDFDLDQFTNHKLKGTVHAAGGTKGVGNFVSKGAITFGDERLKDVQISHLEGNKAENRYTATVSATKLFAKFVDKIPSVEVTPVTTDLTVTYNNGKFGFDTVISAGVKYPKEGTSKIEGVFHLEANATGFAASITEIKITAGEYFKSTGGFIDPQSGEVNIGDAAEFDIPNIAHGSVKGHANVQTGDFHLETEATLSVAALKDTKIKVVVEKDRITASLAAGSPPIRFGKFGSITLGEGTSFDLKKNAGLTGTLAGTIEAKGFGTGEFAFEYADRELSGTATVHADAFAMFAKTDFALSLKKGKISTTNAEGIVLSLAPDYSETFAASATVKIHDNKIDVAGRITELKKLGKITEAFKGADITYDGNTHAVSMTTAVKLDPVIPELASGSTLTLEYKNKVITLEGILKPKSYGPVAFSAESHLTAKWDSGSKHFAVNGKAHAEVANLCTIDLEVEAGVGNGQPGVFGLKGHIDAEKLKEKIKGVDFSTITADFHVLIGSGKQADVNFKVHAGISGIPLAGITDIQASIDAEYQSGQGLSGKLEVTRAKVGEVIADGSISVAQNKFSGGSIHLLADFPSLKIEGRGTIAPGEMGGMNTTADLTVTPSSDSAVAKFVQSGNIHVDIQKWKLMEATGTLNLVPPSFLPLIDPKVVISYKPAEGISAVLKTQFKAPMAKHGELGNFEAGYKKGSGLYAHIDFPLTVPGFEEVTVRGDLNSEEIKLGADLKPKDPGLIKKASIEAGYKKQGGFYLQGMLTLHASDELELDVGVRYDGNGLSVIGITPQDKNDTNEDHEVAGFKQHINVPLLTVGVASLNLQFGMGVAAGYRMPKIKFKNPQIEGGLDALDKGGMPAVTFGGTIAMGAYVALTLSVQIVGEIQLLIASCDAGIGAEICARLDLQLGADVDGRFAPGQGALLKIDPFVGASLDLIASLIATLHAEVCWFTIVDKKWTLASANLAHIELGQFRPFQPLGLQIGGPGGTHMTNGLHLREDAFSQIEEGVKKGGSAAADEEANKDAREKVKPVLDAFKSASHQFENLPDGWQNGMTVAPVNFNSMFPGVDGKAWDYYQDNADTAETIYPQGACKSPVEKLSKAVAIMARRNPVAAGMLILSWRRAQIAHMGINPDTGVNVVLEREEVQGLIEAKYQADLLEAQTKQKAQDEEHAQHVQTQTTQFTKAEVEHTKLGQQQKAEHDAKTARTQTTWKDADKKLGEASVKAEKEGAKEKPSAVAKQPPPPPPAAVPVPKPLAKPAPIPVPPRVALPPPAQVLPAVTLPALPTNPGADLKASAPIVPSKQPVAVQSPGKKEAPKGGSPDPTPGVSSNAKQSGGGGGSAMPAGGGGGGGKAGGGGSGGSASPSPAVAAGPAGILSQGNALDAKKAELGGKPAAGKGAKPPAAPPPPAAAKPAAGGTPATGPKTPAGAPPAGDKAGAPGAKAAGGPLDPTVQKVVDAGKADEKQQKTTLSTQDKEFQAKVNAKSDAAKAEAKKLDLAAEEAKKKKEDDAKKAVAASAATAAPGAAPAKPGDKPKGPIGQKVVLDILGEIHTQYMETTGVPMVASTPMQVTAKLDEIDGSISKAPSDIKNVAAPRIATARAQATQLASLGAKAAGGDATALTAVTPAQQTLAPSLKTSWSWAKVASDPAVTSGSIEDPLLHPYYTTFKARVTALSASGHIAVDAGPFAEAIWTKICKAVKAANPAMTDPKAYSDFEKGWLDMKSPKFLQAISEFDHLGKEIAKAATTSLAKAAHFGFWSKDEGRALAEQISDVTLETSAVGALMDGLPTLDGKKAGWDPEIWGALSHAYASAIIPEIVKGKKVNVCIGAGVPPGNIWEAVESVALTKGLEKVGLSLEAVSTYYGAAAKTKGDRKVLDHTKLANGIKGCVYVGTRGGAIAAANAHFAKLTDAPVATPAVAAPGATPAAATPAPGSAPAVAAPGAATPKPGAPAAPTAVPNAVSKHAAGAPPAGWRGNVLKAVPSTDVAADDPGHTYHLLKDGSGVATSEENKLAPAQQKTLQTVAGFTPPPKPPLTQDAYSAAVRKNYGTQIADLVRMAKENGSALKREIAKFELTLEQVTKLKTDFEAQKGELDEKKKKAMQAQIAAQEAALPNAGMTMVQLLEKAKGLCKQIETAEGEAKSEKAQLDGCMQASIIFGMQIDPESGEKGRVLYVTIDTKLNPEHVEQGRAAGMAEAEVAAMAVNHRNWLRHFVRTEIMQDANHAEILFLRDLGLVGARTGMTLEQVMAKVIRELKKPDAKTKEAALRDDFTLPTATPAELDKIYAGVIGSAGKTNPGVNASSGADKNAPPATGTPPADPAVSKHASGPPPADWSANVEKAIPSTDVAPDDPGHTYHLLKDGSGVTTSVPKKLAEPQVQTLRAKVGLPGLPKDKDESKLEAFITDELLVVRKGNYSGATVNTVSKLVNDLGAFQLGLDLKKAWVAAYPKNAKVIEAKEFLKTSESALEDACHKDFVMTVLAKTASPKSDPDTHRALGKLKLIVDPWHEAFKKEPTIYSAGISTCVSALADIEKAQAKILKDRDLALAAAAAAIDAVDAAKPGETIKVEMAKVQIWIDDLALGSHDGPAKVVVARKLKEEKIALAAKAAADAKKPAAPPVPAADPKVKVDPTAPPATPTAKPVDPAAAKTADPTKPVDPATAVDPKKPVDPNAPADPKAAQLKIDQAKAAKEKHEKQLELLETQLELKMEQALGPFEGFNAAASIAIGAAGWLALLNPGVAIGIASIKLIAGFATKYKKAKALIASKAILKTLSEAQLTELEGMFKGEAADFKVAVNLVKQEAANDAARAKASSKATGGAAKTATKGEAGAIPVDTVEIGANAVKVAGEHAIEAVGEHGLEIAEHATAILGPVVALFNFGKNLFEVHHLKHEVKDIEKELAELREKWPSGAGAAPKMLPPPPPPPSGLPSGPAASFSPPVKPPPPPKPATPPALPPKKPEVPPLAAAPVAAPTPTASAPTAAAPTPTASAPVASMAAAPTPTASAPAASTAAAPTASAPTPTAAPGAPAVPTAAAPAVPTAGPASTPAADKKAQEDKTKSETAKSKYAAGPAPAGWDGRVRGTTPSEAVAPDDPGHTYHILDDDHVVATTEPVLLAPGSSISQRAIATKPKSEQLIIAASQRFEITVGNHMAGIANGAVKGLMAQVHGYLNAKVKPYASDAAKVETELKKLGGNLAEQWAGRIPPDLKVIESVLKGEGNIREAITLFNNFVGKILNTDLKEGVPAGAMAALLPEVQALSGDAASRDAKALETFKTRRQRAQEKADSVTGTWKDNKPDLPGHQGETREQSHQSSVPAHHNPIEGATFGGWHEGVPDTDGRNPSHKKPPADLEPKKHPTRENDNWWLHAMTVEEFTALGGVLSAHEKKLFNEGIYRQALAARKASIVDENTFMQAVREAEAEAKKYVPWAAGFMGYHLKWDSANAVNLAFKNLSVPVGAGVSGTTARTMQSLGAVGIDAVTALKICLGYLLPIQAHSFSEVRTAGVAMGVPGYAPARGSHNYNQTPLKGDVESMPGWAEFDRLYSPAAIGHVAATKPA